MNLPNLATRWDGLSCEAATGLIARRVSEGILLPILIARRVSEGILLPILIARRVSEGCFGFFSSLHVCIGLFVGK